MLLLLLFTAISCPVITTPTVRGTLGDVEVKVTHENQDSGYLCQFIAADAELGIEVGTLKSSNQFKRFAENACGAGQNIKQLKGIGNEAVACTVGPMEIIAGRVRNQSFLLRLTKSTRDNARDLAEIVAGNLF